MSTITNKELYESMNDLRKDVVGRVDALDKKIML